jgi:hypothetical protein
VYSQLVEFNPGEFIMPLCAQTCTFKVETNVIGDHYWLKTVDGCPGYCGCSLLDAFSSYGYIATQLPSGFIMKIKCGGIYEEQSPECTDCNQWCEWRLSRVGFEPGPYTLTWWNNTLDACYWYQPCQGYTCECAQPNIVLNDGGFIAANWDILQDLRFETMCMWQMN